MLSFGIYAAALLNLSLLASAQVFMQIGSQSDDSNLYRSQDLSSSTKHDAFGDDLLNLLHGAVMIREYSLSVGKHGTQPSMDDVSLSKSQDVGTVLLMQALVTNSKLPLITLATIRNETYTVNVLREVVVSSVSTNTYGPGSWNAEIGSDEWVRLTPGSIEMIGGVINGQQLRWTWTLPEAAHNRDEEEYPRFVRQQRISKEAVEDEDSLIEME